MISQQKMIYKIMSQRELSELIIFFIFTGGLYLFLSYRFHYLVMIIALEMIILSLILTSITAITVIPSISYFLFFIVIVVCSGSFGVTVIMKLYRTSGGDIFNY
jgi:NADH:ubiquinone oxidoreductase subunit K